MVNFKDFVVVLFVGFSACVSALVPIDESEMAEVNGQAGITVVTETRSGTSIGEIRYDDTGSDGLGGVLSVRGIAIEDTSSTLVIDVASDELIVSLTDFATTDMQIDAVQFGYDPTLADLSDLVVSTPDQLQNYYGSLGRIFINDYTLDESSDISFKFSQEGEIKFTAGMLPGSFFYFTYVDDGEFGFDINNDGDATFNDTSGYNYISTRVEFEDFRAEDIVIAPEEEAGGRTSLKLTLASITGGIKFEDININGKIAGSIGYSNIDVSPVSYLKVRGY